MDHLINVFCFTIFGKMNFYLIVNSILKLTVPYKNLNYYRQYFIDCKLILIDKDKSEIFKIKLLCVFAFYETVHLLLISSKTQSQTEQLASFNVSPFFTKSNLLNYIYALICIEGIYFLNIQYFKLDICLVKRLENILFYNLPKNLFISKRYKERLVQDIVQLFAVLFVNSLAVFILVCDFCVIYNLFCYLQLIIQFKIYNVFTLFQFIFNLIIFAIAYMNNSHVLILSASFFLTLLFSHYLALKQLYKELKFINSTSLFKFQSFHVHILTSILKINKYMSTLFLVFLILNCPSNAYVGSWLIRDKKATFYAKTFVAVFCSHQNFCTIFYHFLFSYFSKFLHYPSKALLSLMPKSFKNADISTKLRLHNFIHAIHCTKKYGFTYGNNQGLITVNSFTKVKQTLLQL